jgi:IS5 family transposase
LIEEVENYRQRFGFYPKAVIVDKIYRTRANQKYCNGKGIRLSGPPLGRPKMDAKEREKVKAQERKDISIRNAVEGEFGTGKRKYGLGLIMTKLPDTSEAVIAVNFFLLNLEKKLGFFLRQIFIRIFLENISSLPCI